MAHSDKYSISFHLIEESIEAHEMVEQLIQSDWLAVDMEFYWRSSYYPQLCLLQIADQQRSVVIDVLSDSFSDEDVKNILQKLVSHHRLIFHSGRQDWQIFYQYCEKIPDSVLDIQYAGVYYGLGESPSLGRLIEPILHCQKSNQEQCSDWRQRPLTQQQIAYARLDVEYIAYVYLAIHKQLDAKQLLAMEQDSTEALRKARIKTPLKELASKIWGYEKLSPKKQLLLQELVEWRERYAQEKNCPVTWICTNNVLFECVAVDDLTLLLKSGEAKKRSKKCKQEKFSMLTPIIKKQIQEIHCRISCFSDEEVKQCLCKPKVGTKRVVTEIQRKIIADVKKYVDTIIEKDPLLSKNMIGKKLLLSFLQQPNDNLLLFGWRYYFIGEKLLKISQKEINKWSKIK